MASDLGYGLVRAAGESRQRPIDQMTEEEKRIAARRLIDIGKGAASAPFTWAPDLMGLIMKGAAKIPSISAGGRVPELSGDPIREAVGLDPGSIYGVIGEFLDPTAMAGKGIKLGSAALSGLLPAVVRKGKKPLQVSSRIPSSKRTPVDEWAQHLRPDVESMMEHPEHAEKVFDTFRDLPNVRKELRHASSDKLDAYLREHMSDNLQFLYDQLPREVSGRAAKWYEGANIFSRKLASDFSAFQR